MKNRWLILLIGIILLLCSCDKQQLEATEPQATEPQGKEIVITEYMSSNTRIIYDAEGDYPDWVELHNETDRELSLEGFYLSDDEAEPKKWSFPALVSLKPDEYRLIFLSGKNFSNDEEIHASFKLGKDDKYLLISKNTGEICDKIEVLPLKENISAGRNEAGDLVYYAMPTPAKPNFIESFAELSMIRPQLEGVYISEVCAATEDNDRDWIELYNSTDRPVNLSGYGLCKSLTSKKRFIFGQIIVEPKAFVTVDCRGSEAEEGEAGFKLDSSGEDIYLLDNNQNIIDEFSTGKLSPGYSSGRQGQEAERLFFDELTKGQANSERAYKGYCKPPIVTEGGFFHKVATIKMTAPKGCELYYTTDGSVPTTDSEQYTGPFSLSETTSLRVRAFSLDGELLPSDCVCETYILDKQHDIAVIAITSEPDGLFSYSRGIYADGPGYSSDSPHYGANFWQDWERPAQLEYFEDGKKCLQFSAGIKIFGQFSRANAQKAFAVHLRDCYGSKELSYPFFEGNPVTTMSSFVLRAGDPYYTKLRDELACEIMKRDTKAAVMDWRPVALYINGEYWGLYFLREKINESYFESHFGLDGDNLDIIKTDAEVLSGDLEAFRQLRAFARDNDLSIEENYNKISQLMDIESYTDYLLGEIFFYNLDSGNMKCFRERSDEGKFAWVFFDLDQALYVNARDRSDSSLQYFLGAQGHGQNHQFSNVLVRSLLQNSAYRDYFLKRYAYFLNTIFIPENMLSILDEMMSLVENEMQYQCERWRLYSVEGWRENCESLKQTLALRREVCISQLIDWFELSASEQRALFPNDYK